MVTFISLAEVCSILSISAATAKNWIRLGNLPVEPDGKTFRKDCIDKLALEIKSGKDGRLKNRRNKKAVSGSALYKDYIKCGKNIDVVENILASFEHISENELRLILAFFALQMYRQKNSTKPQAAGEIFSSQPTGSEIISGLPSDISTAAEIVPSQPTGSEIISGLPSDISTAAEIVPPQPTGSEIISGLPSDISTAAEIVPPQPTDSEVFNSLLTDLLAPLNLPEMNISNILPIFNYQVQFVPTEDTLGFIYISLRDLGSRKQTGTYYTPEKTASALIDALLDCVNLDSASFCDPCCGTGNFLIGLVNRGVNALNIYGQDLDEVSVFITRINMYLLDPALTRETLLSHFTIGNALAETFTAKFSVVLGNPPWGYDYTKEETARLMKYYRTAKAKGTESYDLFIEKGLALLENGGYLAYVLPEAVLNVGSHAQARKVMLDQASFKFVNYLGDTFSGIQCPAIILGLQKDMQGHTKGCRVKTCTSEFTIQKERRIDAPAPIASSASATASASSSATTPATASVSASASSFAFNINDAEYSCIEAINKVDNARYLAGNAKFALGIVTGNNRKYVTSSNRNGFEAVLRGSDIFRYSIKKPSSYIEFAPESFQQTAPTEIYRAPEKLLYRFISKVPIFAYDNKQTLSLNSCNILIPQIEGLQMKYVLAVLNSRLAAFYISKRFNSVKLLRSHIEALPIPFVSATKQQEIVEKVDSLLALSALQNSNFSADLPKTRSFAKMQNLSFLVAAQNQSSSSATKLPNFANVYEKYNTIDELIMEAYKLTPRQKDTIRSASS